MEGDSSLPISLLLSDAFLRATAWLVPEADRFRWQQEWKAELFHRREFLVHSGEWTPKEAFRFACRTAQALPDAALQFVSQEAVQHRIREIVRSPWTCLAALGVLLVVLGFMTSGFRATRGIFQLQRDNAAGRIVFIWRHSVILGGDRLLPEEVAFAWDHHSNLLESAAAFTANYRTIERNGRIRPRTLVVDAEPDFFKVLAAKPAVGSLPGESEIALTDSFWREFFHADRSIIGQTIQIGTGLHRVAAVLPPSFRFLSFQPAVYLVRQYAPLAPMMIVGRVKPNVSERNLNKELVHIAEADCYYFYRGELRYSFLAGQLWTPVRMFSIAVAIWTVLLVALAGVRWRHIRVSFARQHRTENLGRVGFFAAKTGLALLLVFIGGLESSRSNDAILFGARDPGCGPFLLWIYILGAMAVLLWSIADQRARCRVCLRLLGLPVRMGSPGSLFLDWAGTELLCTEGHGLLHVPHLAPSWEEESDRWIALDDSWKEFFVDAK